MKLRYPLILSKMDDRYAAVVTPHPNATRFNGLIWLDENGKEIIELLRTDISKEELISRLPENHHASRDAVKNTVDRFLAILNENDLLI